MVGLVIASHGHLADELLATAALIVGAVPAAATCNVTPGASPAHIQQQLLDAVNTVESGDGVIVLTDLLGGTPCNQSLSICQQANIEVLTGVNLPMVLKANSLREAPHSLHELARELAQYGQSNIRCVTDAVRSTRD